MERRVDILEGAKNSVFSYFRLEKSKIHLERKQLIRGLPRMHSITIRLLSALTGLEIDINTNFQPKHSVQTQVRANMGSSTSISQDTF
jgi:hypothetical protein